MSGTSCSETRSAVASLVNRVGDDAQHLEHQIGHCYAGDTGRVKTWRNLADVSADHVAAAQCSQDDLRIAR